jgi:hypothetical protein
MMTESSESFMVVNTLICVKKIKEITITVILLKDLLRQVGTFKREKVHLKKKLKIDLINKRMIRIISMNVLLMIKRQVLTRREFDDTLTIYELNLEIRRRENLENLETEMIKMRQSKKSKTTTKLQ